MSKITIITPIFNAEKFIQNSYKSITKQSLKELEIIYINDGSTDSSLKIIEQIASEDNRVHIINQSNKGSGQARNEGLKNAKSEFVTFLDADDWYPDSNVLEVLYNTAKKYSQKMAGGSFVRYYENGKIESNFNGIYKAYKFEKEEIINFNDYQFDYGYHRFIYDRKMLIENNIIFPDYKRFQDPPFFLRAQIASKSFVSVPMPVYAYRKGHQIVEWNIEKLSGLLMGLIENLYLSKTYKMDKLHKIIIDRVEEDFFKDITKRIKNDTIRYLLYKFIYMIDSKLVSCKIENLKIYKELKK